MKEKYALNLAEDGRILSATYAKYAPADAVLVDELPEGNLFDYRWQDGTFVYDPLQEPELEVEAQATCTENREAVEQSLTDLFLDGIQAQQDITELQLEILGG